MSISNDQKQQVYEEKLYFAKSFDIETGNEVNPNEDHFVNDKQEMIEPLDVITVRFNKKVYDNIIKYIQRVITMRAIKQPDNIDAKDYTVKKAIDKYKAKYGGKITPEQIERFVEQVRQLNEAQYSVTLFQVVAWAIIYEDVFKVSNNTINSKFDVKVEDEYWQGNIKQNIDDLDKMLDNFVVKPMNYEKTNPLEVMLAITTTILTQYKDFAERLTDLITKRVMPYIGLENSEEKFDDIGYFRSRLDELLS